MTGCTHLVSDQRNTLKRSKEDIKMFRKLSIFVNISFSTHFVNKIMKKVLWHYTCATVDSKI